MANLSTTLEKIPVNVLKEIIEACNKSFQKELNTEGFYGKGQTTWSIPEIGLVYKSTQSNQELEKFVENLTNTKDVRQAYAKIYEEWETKSKGTDVKIKEAPKQVDANMPSEGTRAQQNEDLTERNAAIAEANKAAKERVQEFLKSRKLYVKLQAKYNPPKTDPQEQANFERTQQLAKSDPQTAQADLKALIDQKATVLLKDVPVDQAELIKNKAAYDIASALISDPNTVSPIKEAIILSSVKQNPEIEKIINNPEALKVFQREANEFAIYDVLPYQQTIAISEGVFGKTFTNQVFGDYNPENFDVSFYNQPTDGFTHTIDLEGINENYETFQNRQSGLLSGFGSFPKDEIQHRITLQVNSLIKDKILSLPENNALRSLYVRPEFQSLLSTFGVGETATTLVPGNFVGKFVLDFAPEYAPTLNSFGELTGVEFFSASAGAVAGSVFVPTFIISEGATTIVGSVATAETVATFGSSGAVTIAGFGFEAATTTVVAGTSAGVTTTVIETASVAAAPATAGLSLVIGAVTAVVSAVAGPKVIDFIANNSRKIGRFVLTAGGVGFGFAVGGIPGGIVGGGAGYITGGLLSGGYPALQSSVSSFASAAGAAGDFVWTTFLAGVGLPILVTLLVFPVVVALILFIINSGAYIVPPGQSLLNSTNPYIDVSKVANPPGPLSSPQTITYTITITAKKDTLTGISLKNTCKSIGKNGISINCEDLEKMPDSADIPAQVVPGAPYSFTFTSNYDSKYQDSLVSDSVVVTALAGEAGKVTETGSASLCFGDCPLNCFKLPDNRWPQDSNIQSFKSALAAAAGRISTEEQNFAAKVCPANGPVVNLCYTNGYPASGSGFFARDVEGSDPNQPECTINFNKDVAAYGPEGIYFLLTHEVTHHIQQINGHWEQLYRDYVDPREHSVCTYGGTEIKESMAEGDALFVAKPIIDKNGSCLTNYQSQYPYHYKFARNCMFSADCKLQ